MNWEDHVAKSREFQRRFLEKLPKTDDLTLLVLKGHLLIEELVNSTIDALLPNPGALAGARLDCFQRIRLLMALIPDDFGLYGALEAFEKLNTIRNKYSHVLEPPQIEDRIMAFIEVAESKMQPDTNAMATTLSQRLSAAICFYSGQL